MLEQRVAREWLAEQRNRKICAGIQQNRQQVYHGIFRETGALIKCPTNGAKQACPRVGSSSFSDGSLRTYLHAQYQLGVEERRVFLIRTETEVFNPRLPVGERFNRGVTKWCMHVGCSNPWRMSDHGVPPPVKGPVRSALHELSGRYITVYCTFIITLNITGLERMRVCILPSCSHMPTGHFQTHAVGSSLSIRVFHPLHYHHLFPYVQPLHSYFQVSVFLNSQVLHAIVQKLSLPSCLLVLCLPPREPPSSVA